MRNANHDIVTSSMPSSAKPGRQWVIQCSKAFAFGLVSLCSLTACVSLSPSEVEVVEKKQPQAYCRPDLRTDKKIVRNLTTPYEDRYYLLEPGELCSPN